MNLGLNDDDVRGNVRAMLKRLRADLSRPSAGLDTHGPKRDNFEWKYASPFYIYEGAPSDFVRKRYF